MKRKYFVLLFLLISGLSLSAQDFMTNVAGRKTTSLAGRWEILIDMFSRGERMGVYKNLTPQDKTTFYEYHFSDASRLNVPGDWNSQRPDLKYYESSIWYKRDFKYDLKPGDRLFVYFGAANYKCTAYLNGQKLGTHTGGFTPFQFEITDLVKRGDNFLIVEVNNRRGPEQIPAMIYDWWNFGGLTRDVLLVETPSDYINDYFIRLEKGSFEKIFADVELSSKTAGQTVKIEIPEAGVNSTMTTDTDGKAKAVIPVKKLSLWSPENPKLYDVAIISGRDTVREQIGFRTIETKGNKIVLNGKELFLRGVNCHEEIPMRQGRAYSDADVTLLLDEVQALGCNFLRPTHYSPGENMMREAERRGIMLFDEIPQWGPDIDYKNPATNALACEMMKEMIRRDKNRCAVIAWSIVNESKLYPERDKALKGLFDLTRSLDTSRLVMGVTDKVRYDEKNKQFVSDDNMLPYYDIICINRYFGWYSPWPVAPENVKWNIAPEKPFIYSEFGAEALYGNHGPADLKSSWSEEYQEAVYKDHVKMFESMGDNLAGTIPWVLYDFRSPYRMNQQYQEEWNRKGLVSENGFRKKAWYVMHDYYAKKAKEEAAKTYKSKDKKK